ncbi:trihelix transcription factor ASIL1-like isoform X3 [Phoenix dactylifera]|uniref:Trihelix transcription factor ASIL1-like isoform X3 n=1 Tax=Phoenix dactylifera TaxID=42345 RepID=A0A8B9AGV6_PHODC|nr:trihelix transcription factor ASIL1-like isoform X3 [Phoenix dactylifera]
MDSAQGGINHLPAGPGHSPVPAPRGPDKGKRDEWSESGVLCLLEVYESKWLLRNRAKLKGSDWEDIARQVSARCSGRKALKTPAQCKNKIESMKKRYRAESAAAHEPKSCSSWQFYARMDGLLKGPPDCMAQTKSNHNINLQALPKVAAEVEVEGRLKDSNQDDASNALPVDANAVNKDNDSKKESKGDSDASAPRNKEANAEDGAGKDGNPSKKRRKGSGDEVADSIRLLAQSILKIEQARIEMYKDSERMRVEAEIKRGEMELKRTEIIAKTQLQIVKLLAKKSRGRSNKSEGSSSRIELDMLPRRDGMIKRVVNIILILLA